MNNLPYFIKHNISCFCFYIQTIWNIKKSIFLLTVFDSILGSMISFLWIFFFKYFLDYMADGVYGKAVLWVFICVCSSEMAETIKGYLNQKRENAFFDINTELETRLAQLSIEIPYEKIENTDTIQRFEISYKCLDRNYLAVYTDGLVNMVSSLLVISGVGAISIALGWWVSAILFLVIIANAACYVMQSRHEVEAFHEETAVSRQLEHTRFWLTEKSRAKEVRTYILQNFVVKKMEEYNEKFFKILRSFNKKQKRAYIGVCLLNGIQMATVYFYCAYLCFRGSLTVGDFMLHVSALLSLSSSITHLLEAWIDVYKNNQYIDGLKLCLGMRAGVASREDFAEGFESIEFQNVSFRYSGEDQNALNHVSFILHKNEKLSLIGENGAGKSTLVKLLVGLYMPTEGRILINGKTIEPEKVNYMSLFSMIFQDYTIFHFSVGENINMGKGVPQEVCRGMLDEIGLEHVGLDTFISQTFSEDGIELSGGENQKLAMIRALCKDAPVVILDEPTAALSPQSEYEIYQKFRKLTQDRAVIFISHRLSSCRICDKILLLQKGFLKAAGTHDEMMESSLEYREMFNAQAMLYR